MANQPNYKQEGILGYELKTPESQKNKEWFLKIMDGIIPYDNTVGEKYTRLRKLYGVLNNDLSIIKEELEALCKPVGDLFDILGSQDEQIVSYNRIFPKYNYHLGQLGKYGDNIEVMRLSDAGNALWNRELREELQKSIDEKMKLTFEMEELKSQGKTTAEQQQYYEQMRSYDEPENIDTVNFTSSVEDFNAKILDYFRFKFNLDHMKKNSFKHVLVADECQIGILELNGKPTPIVLNPLHFGYHKSPDTEYIQDGDYWWYRMPITVSQAYGEIHDEVDEEDLSKILAAGGSGNLRPSKKWDITKPGAQTTRDYSSYEMFAENDKGSKEIGQHMDIHSDTRNRNGSEYIWKTFLQFIAYREVYFLTYKNDYNREVTEVVPSNYPIPKDATTRRVTNRYGKKVERKEWVDLVTGPMYIERMWIPRKYQAVRYGSDTLTNFRESPNQAVNVEDPFSLELDVKGKVFNALNAQSTSLVERALPTFLQYVFIKNLQNKELSKYEGVIRNIDASQIPDYLANDENGEPLFDGIDKMAVHRYYRKKLGDSYTDSTLLSNGFQNHTRSNPVTVEYSNNFAEIANMQNLLEMIDREMGLQMLVPPQAEGVFAPYSNVADNQTALNQGYIMAEEIYAEFNEVWRTVANEYLKQFRAYYRKFFEDNPDMETTSLNYITSAGTRQVMKITPEMLSHEDIGIFTRESGYGRRYREYMLQQIQAFSQNAGEGVPVISELVMAVARGENPEEIHKRLVMADRKQQERLQEMQKIQDQMNQKAKLLERELEEAMDQREHAQEIEIVNIKGDQKLEEALIKTYSFQDDLNKDQDGIPDPIEAVKVLRELDQGDRKIENDRIKAEASMISAKKTNKSS